MGEGQDVAIFRQTAANLRRKILSVRTEFDFFAFKYKKFELMLTRRAKAYSSSCSQTVSLSPAISSQFILGVCTAAEDRKNKKTLF